jgi:hypothetical protein
MRMNRKRAIGTVLSAVTAAGLGAGIAQAIPAGAAAAPAPKYVVVTCKRGVAHKPARLANRPVGWTIFCADPHADRGRGISDMTWLRWTSHLASGYGYFIENDNYPSPAQGKSYMVPAVVTLWGSAYLKGHPDYRTYTRITLMFPGKRPPVYKKVNGKWTATYPQTQTFGP